MGWINKKTKTYALIGTSTGLVLGCASLATGISLFFLETKLEKNLKIYLIILGCVFIIAFIAPVIIISLMKVPKIDIRYIQGTYNSTTNKTNCLIYIKFLNNPNDRVPITSYSITAEYIDGTNSNTDNISTIIENPSTEIDGMNELKTPLNILLPSDNTYKIRVIATNLLGNSYPTTRVITINRNNVII